MKDRRPYLCRVRPTAVVFIVCAALAAMSSAAPACESDSSLLCLGGRFAVEVDWEDHQGGHGQGTAVPLTADAGYFWFFNDDNVELVVKVLDGRDLNGHFWVFYGALSNVGYRIRVTDQITGEIKEYENPNGTFASIADTAAFHEAPGNGLVTDPPLLLADPAGSRESPLSDRASTQPAPCDLEGLLCLGDGRFQLTAQWLDRDGNRGVATAAPLTDDTGMFWFFNPDNTELVVKVLDGTELNDHHWVFYGALSDVEYTLTVFDTQTGRTAAYHNALGTLASVGDTQALGPSSTIEVDATVSESYATLGTLRTDEGVVVDYLGTVDTATVSARVDEIRVEEGETQSYRYLLDESGLPKYMVSTEDELGFEMNWGEGSETEFLGFSPLDTFATKPPLGDSRSSSAESSIRSGARAGTVSVLECNTPIQRGGINVTVDRRDVRSGSTVRLATRLEAAGTFSYQAPLVDLEPLADACRVLDRALCPVCSVINQAGLTGSAAILNACLAAGPAYPECVALGMSLIFACQVAYPGPPGTPLPCGSSGPISPLGAVCSVIDPRLPPGPFEYRAMVTAPGLGVKVTKPWMRGPAPNFRVNFGEDTNDNGVCDREEARVFFYLPRSTNLSIQVRETLLAHCFEGRERVNDEGETVVDLVEVVMEHDRQYSTPSSAGFHSMFRPIRYEPAEDRESFLWPPTTTCRSDTSGGQNENHSYEGSSIATFVEGVATVSGSSSESRTSPYGPFRRFDQESFTRIDYETGRMHTTFTFNDEHTASGQEIHDYCPAPRITSGTRSYIQRSGSGSGSGQATMLLVSEYFVPLSYDDFFANWQTNACRDFSSGVNAASGR